jgi:hypothetical protein
VCVGVYAYAKLTELRLFSVNLSYCNMLFSMLHDCLPNIMGKLTLTAYTAARKQPDNPSSLRQTWLPVIEHHQHSATKHLGMKRKRPRSALKFRFSRWPKNRSSSVSLVIGSHNYACLSHRVRTARALQYEPSLNALPSHHSVTFELIFS